MEELAKKSWLEELRKGGAGHCLPSSRGVRAVRVSQESVRFRKERKGEQQKAGSYQNCKVRNGFIILVH